ncbi:MAG: hypothetical protein LV481_03290 [Methylacidiphilales bacterium]|nr:hypothetical protein [Candidatus Methylacidiphilales bacterium]
MNRPTPEPAAGAPLSRTGKTAGPVAPSTQGRAGQVKPGCEFKSQGRINKIRTLPSAIRDEVSRRLEEGHIPREIAEWLNTVEEVRKILAEKWHGAPVERRAVDRWRQTGYLEWRRKHEHLEQLKELSEYALKLGQAAGGSIADGSAAIAGGRIMSILENASDEDMLKMVHAITELRAGDFTKERLKQGGQKLELERQRFQLQSTELFIKWYADKKARDIVESRADNREKIEKLGRIMFGEAWRC